ncbi:MAG: N-acetylneuraminate synthase [Bacteroidetes bacterium]|nr:N-acetylneuraminate synthase [Bacteroidota bacterium]
MIRIIAEAGVNHNGDMQIAKQLIDVASEAGADYVKFQTFIASQLVSADAPKAAYQREDNTGGNQLEMLQKLELSREQHIELAEHCRKKNIHFLSTAFDLESIGLLTELGITLFKVPSGEITNLPYLKKIGSLGKDVILSTGMCVMEEITEAISVLVKAGTNRENITVLHCTTDYPTKMQDVNLKAMLSIREQLDVNIGYSDHTLGIEVPVAAAALGAQVIEKHFTLDRALPGPDHKASLEPAELKNMVTAIRNIEEALGSGAKQPTATELENRMVARKSIHVAKALPRGHVITEADLAMKRPGTGISPMLLENILGKRTRSELSAGHLLRWEELE